MFFPNEWKALLEHRSDPKASVLSSYHSLVTNQSNPWGQRVKAARAWLTWDCLGSSLSSPGGDLFVFSSKYHDGRIDSVQQRWDP